MSSRVRRNSSLVSEVVISKADNSLVYLELLDSTGIIISDSFLDKISEIRKTPEKISAMNMFEDNSWKIETPKHFYIQKVISKKFSDEIAVHIEGAYLKHTLKQGTSWLFPQVSDEMYQKIKKSLIQ